MLLDMIADKCKLIALGLDPGKEMAFKTPAGQWFVFPNAKTEPYGCSYVRFVDDNGQEQLYYDADEWTESRYQGEEVMGAILGAIVCGANLADMSGEEENSNDPPETMSDTPEDALLIHGHQLLYNGWVYGWSSPCASFGKSGKWIKLRPSCNSPT